MQRTGWLLLLGGTLLTAHAAGDRVQSCQASWDQAYAAAQQQGGDYDAKGLLQKWLALEGQCRGTGVYEYRLAALYVGADQPKRALEILHGAKSFPTHYASMVPLLKLQAELTILGDQTPLPMEKIRELEPRFVAALREAPQEYSAYEQVANYMLLIGDDREAISLGEKSIAMRENEWNAHRTLTLAYMSVGEFDQSIRHARRAADLRNSLTADPPFMYAVAKSYAGIGNITVAKKTLGMLIQERPSEKGSAEFNDAINFLAAQIKKGNVHN